MQWLDKMQSDFEHGVCSSDFYDGCIETMYQTNQIGNDEYNTRMQWVKDQEAKKTKELLERVK